MDRLHVAIMYIPGCQDSHVIDSLSFSNEFCSGAVQLHREITANLELKRVACPIGVLAVIFEARPEAVVQIASLSLKSGNAVVLKGGKEALHSNEAIVGIMRQALRDFHAEDGGGEGGVPSANSSASASAGSSSGIAREAKEGSHIPVDSIQLVETREQIAELLHQDKYVDVSESKCQVS